MLNVLPITNKSEQLLSSAKEIVKRYHRHIAKNFDYNKEFNLFAKYDSTHKGIQIYELKEPKLITTIPFPYFLNPDKEKLTFEMGDEVKFSVCNNLLIITTFLALEDYIFPKIVYTVPKFELINFLFPECEEIVLKENIFFVFQDDNLSKYSNLPFLPEWEIEKEVQFNSFESYQLAENHSDTIPQNLLN